MEECISVVGTRCLKQAMEKSLEFPFETNSLKEKSIVELLNEYFSIQLTQYKILINRVQSIRWTARNVTIQEMRELTEGAIFWKTQLSNVVFYFRRKARLCSQVCCSNPTVIFSAWKTFHCMWHTADAFEGDHAIVALNSIENESFFFNIFGIQFFIQLTGEVNGRDFQFNCRKGDKVA